MCTDSCRFGSHVRGFFLFFGFHPPLLSHMLDKVMELW